MRIRSLAVSAGIVIVSPSNGLSDEVGKDELDWCREMGERDIY